MSIEFVRKASKIEHQHLKMPMAAPLSSGLILTSTGINYAFQIEQQRRLGMPLKQCTLSQLPMSMEFVRYVRKVKSKVNV